MDKARRLKLLADALVIITAVMLALWLYVLSLSGFGGDDLAAALSSSVAYLSFSVVGLLIITRQPSNIIGWLCAGLALLSFFGAFIGDYVYYAFEVADEEVPLRDVAAAIPNLIWPFPVLGPPLLIPALFPNGKPLSERWRVPLIAGIVMLSAMGLVSALVGDGVDGPDSPLIVDGAHKYLEPFFPVLLFGWVGCFFASVASFFLRFRRSSGQARLQMKWFAFSLALAFLLVMANDYVTIGGDTSNVLFNIGLTLIAWSIGIGVLRYRLYDIDRLINRTMVYALVTAILAIVYLGLVIGLQAISRPLSGGSDLAIALTTLIVAALFLPARRRVQALVDRRFNRRAYDASRTIEAFGVRLRQHTDLDTLRYELLSVVDETMEPSRVQLWLKNPAR